MHLGQWTVSGMSYQLLIARLDGKYIYFNVLEAFDNMYFHHSVVQGSSVKISCCGISKSTSG